MHGVFVIALYAVCISLCVGLYKPNNPLLCFLITFIYQLVLAILSPPTVWWVNNAFLAHDSVCSVS